MSYLLALHIFFFFNGLNFGFQHNFIQGEVYDFKTKEAIPYVNIWIKSKDIRLTSNSEGKFILPVNPSLYQDTMVFSSIGYKPLVIVIKQLLGDKKPRKTIFLQEDIYPLQEVVVRPLTARQIVQKGIEHIPENHLNTNYQVRGFYRKAIKENNAFAFLVESVVDISDTGYDKKQFQTSYLKSRLSKDYRTFKLPLEKDVIAKSLELDHLQYRRGFLNSHNLDNWQYKIVGYTKIDNKDAYIIQASLFGSKKSAAHQAKIYIRSEDYAFQKIDYDYTWDDSDLQEHANPSDTINIKKYNWKGSFNYISYKGKMVLNNFHFVLKQNIYSNSYINTERGRMKSTKLLASQESHEEFIANEINTLTKSQSKTQANTTASILESAKPYDKVFWTNYLKPVDSDLFTLIKKDLESHAPLEEVFIKDID